MKTRNNGIALLEVVIAAILFVVAAVPMAVHMNNSMKMERRNMVHTLAVYTAQMEMERMYGLTTDEINGYKYEDPWFDGTFSAEAFDDLGLHAVTVTITSRDFSGTAVEQYLILPMP